MPTVLCNLETSGNGSKEYAIMQPPQQAKSSWQQSTARVESFPCPFQ